MKVGIIGFGRLGKLIAKYMSQDFTLLVHDLHNFEDQIKEIGATPATFEEVCDCPIVIPFVPMSAFEDCIKKMSPLLKENTLVVDVCSVKEMPVDIMKEHLPEKTQIMATHPMFGPDSARDTLFGTKIAVYPVRMEQELYAKISAYLRSHGVKTIEATPEEHDKQIANSLVLTHLIGRSLIDFDAHRLEIDTKGYRRLLKILQTVENDSWQLFEDMNKYNRHAKETRETFLHSLKGVISRLEN